MSDDNAAMPGHVLPPLSFAREYLERRGHALPPTALQLFAREVILRVSRAATPVADRGDLPRRADIDLLCDALVSRDDTAAADLVRMARHGGMSAHTLYHCYIAGAVRQFGERWDRDEVSTAQVILGAGRVYGILRELRVVFLSEHLVAPPGSDAFFASVPGEVHGLGITMAADTLRMRGWNITLRTGIDHDLLVEDIAHARPTMVGLSVSQLDLTLATARLIVALRVRCPQVWIILGGGLVERDPEVVQAVDADAGAKDILDGAAKLAAHLVELDRLARKPA